MPIYTFKTITRSSSTHTHRYACTGNANTFYRPCTPRQNLIPLTTSLNRPPEVVVGPDNTRAPLVVIVTASEETIMIKDSEESVNLLLFRCTVSLSKLASYTSNSPGFRLS